MGTGGHRNPCIPEASMRNVTEIFRGKPGKETDSV